MPVIIAIIHIFVSGTGFGFGPNSVDMESNAARNSATERNLLACFLFVALAMMERS